MFLAFSVLNAFLYSFPKGKVSKIEEVHQGRGTEEDVKLTDRPAAMRHPGYC